ncbi:zinc finger CCCH domain-containing protein 14 [Mantella aurantiaca]
MEIGTEISRKIRTAIKGKLQELGAYVDEELPDYIMVMVANKKSQDQMTDDLSLFLGNNTSRFTTWLQGVLDKLRAVTPGSNSLKASEAIIFNSSMPPLKSREDSGRDPPAQRQEKIHSVVPGASDRTSSDVAARLTSAVKPLQESSPSEDIIDIKLDLDDAFNDDLSFTPETSLHPKKKPATISRTQRPSAQVYRPPGSAHRPPGSAHRPPESAHRPPGSAHRPPESVHRLEERPTLRRPAHSAHLPARQPGFHANRGVSAKPYELQEVFRAERTLQDYEGSRKRKVPVVSSVVKVKRFLEDFEEEEEDDDSSQAAALPSSVSVPSRPERRPTLPPSKQANKNLILKAISEAQESITKTTTYSTVPAKQMVPVAPRSRLPEEELILMKSRASMLRYQEEPQEAPAQEVRHGDERRMDVLSRLHPEPMEEAAVVAVAAAWGQVQGDERRMDILSRLHPEPVAEMSVAPAVSWGRDAEDRENLRPMDSRSFILKSPKVSKTAPMPTPPTTMPTPPTTDTPQQYGRLIQPRVSPLSMERVMETPANAAAAPEKARIPERCKYWPACKNAEHCAYHHPTTVCKAFPKCRFAEKCFFIHPNCKFDAKCTKADCPFTHASRRIPPLPAKQEPNTKSHPKVLCRYFPSCKNTECPFHHPKHCRFSSHCTRTDCEFYHPKTSVPPRHALTWIRSQASD